MRRFWVSFDFWSPTNDNFFVSPGGWVTAFDPVEAETKARKAMKVPDNIQLTIIREYPEDEYQSYQGKLRLHLKSKGVDLDAMN